MNKAYVTYMSNDRDIAGVLVVNHRLQKLNSQYPLCCLCTHDVSTKCRFLLNKNKIQIIDINFYENFGSCNLSSDKLDSLYKKHTFGKLFIFIMQNYKCVYLDSDFYINKNIDHLFDLDTSNTTIHMVNDLLMRNVYDNKYKLLNINNTFNSGLIVFESNPLVFQEICKFINDTPLDILKNWHSDQTVLNYLYKINILNVKVLNHKYNVIFNSINFFVKKELISEEDIHVVHYTLSEKPWLNDSFLKKGAGLCKKCWLKWYEAYYEYHSLNFDNTDIDDFTGIEYVDE